MYALYINIKFINKSKLINLLTGNNRHPSPQSPPVVEILSIDLKFSCSNTIEELQKSKNAVNHGIQPSNNNTPSRILMSNTKCSVQAHAKKDAYLFSILLPIDPFFLYFFFVEIITLQ